MTNEVYVLSDQRSAADALKFLNHFLPLREPAQADYPVPELSDDTKFTFQYEVEILEYLEKHPTETYGLYFNDKNRDFLRAMIFHTNDGKVICGLAVDEEEVDEYLKKLVRFFNAQYSLVTLEQRPPHSSQEFIALCDGKIK